MPPRPGTWREQLRREHQDLRERSRWRSLTTVDANATTARVAGQPLLNLAGNDYLGLATDDGEATACIGAGASRLVTGNHPAFAELEARIAAWSQTDAAVAFSCGYMANTGIIPALVDRQDVVFSDRLNHASILDGIRLSRARLMRYRHLDVDHLAELLVNTAGESYRRRLIVTESLFSMDGDRASLAAIAKLAVDHDCMLVVDEAHATGILGPRGSGLANADDIAGDHVLRVFTFGKGFGLYGACACGSQLLCDQLVNRARTLIYTTGLPRNQVAALASRVQVVTDADAVRDRLQTRCRTFRNSLLEHGLSLGDALGPIFPIVVGSDLAAVTVGEELRQKGILALPIRPPTVPEGTARLRCTVTAAHSDTELQHAAATIARVINALATA